MKNKLLTLVVTAFISAPAFAQSIPKLEISKKETYLVEGNLLQVDTLILHDNATILFEPEVIGRLHAKVAYIGNDCTLSARGKDGEAGKNGRSSRNGLAGTPNVSLTIAQDGEDGVTGEDGTDAGYLELYMNFATLGSLLIDAQGGNGGEGGSGGHGARGKKSELEVRTGTDSKGNSFSYTIEVPGQMGGFGGNGGRGGRPGNGGNVLLVFNVDGIEPIFNQGMVTNGIEILSKRGKTGRNGRPGTGGYQAHSGEKPPVVSTNAIDGKVAVINMKYNLSSME